MVWAEGWAERFFFNGGNYSNGNKVSTKWLNDWNLAH